MMEETELKGVKSLWSSVNHLAIVVSDVGRSLYFYTEVVGMEQINRPDFDRHGAWLTMGNLDLHLIKGIHVHRVGERGLVPTNGKYALPPSLPQQVY